MSARRVDATNQNGELALMSGFLGVVVLGVGGAWVCVHGAAVIDHTTTPPSNPFDVVVGLATGHVVWSPAATGVAIACTAVVVALGAAVVVGIARRARGRMRPDKATAHLGRGRDIAHLTERGVRNKSKRLGVASDVPGLPLAKHVGSGQTIWASWEDMLLLIAGPRTQKTTAWVVPRILDAPGAVVATSNKPDVVTDTRDPRSTVGRVWIFDPQGVAEEPQQWWWDPLSYVTDEMRAAKLAAQFGASARIPGASLNSFFEGEGEDLVALLLLAAAKSGQPIPMVYTWLTEPANPAPVGALREAGYPMQADSLAAMASLVDETRDGLYASARALVRFLRSPAMMAWVTPPASGIPQFRPADFTTTRDTLYLLSREGEGSAGPLVAALTVAVVAAAEQLATRSPHGRLSVPFVAILDEAANICRFKNLDSYYSHFGSRGIIIHTILQNWAQGEEVWGRTGMEKLWSSANIKVYGGGVDDDRFLGRVSALLGEYDYVARSSSTSKGSRQISRSVQRRPILTVADLRDLPPGRAVLLASGTPPILVEPQPWYTGPHAAEIQASIDAHSGPANPSLKQVAMNAPRSNSKSARERGDDE